MSCSSVDDEILNAIHSDNKDESIDPTIIVEYGPFMNWEIWVHNTTRVMRLVDLFTKKGHIVQLQHDKKETSDKESGDVSVYKLDGTKLGTSIKAQHSCNYHKRNALYYDLTTDVLEKL